MENEDWKPDWDENFQAPQKPAVREALLREQGYICCYRGMGVTKDSSHIEHLKPRSSYPHLALEYTNLIASCQREREKIPPVLVHCGVKKDDWYDENLMVSPLEKNCANFFRYSGSGEILPTINLDKKAVAETTIDKLGLGIDKLRAMRREAIDGVLLDIDRLTPEEIQQLIQGYEQLDSNGQYTPFCVVITYLLKQYFVNQ